MLYRVPQSRNHTFLFCYKALIDFLVRLASNSRLETLFSSDLWPTLRYLAKSLSTKLSLTGSLENFSSHRGSLRQLMSSSTPSSPLFCLDSFRSLPKTPWGSSLGFCRGASDTAGHFCCWTGIWSGIWGLLTGSCGGG